MATVSPINHFSPVTRKTMSAHQVLTLGLGGGTAQRLKYGEGGVTPTSLHRLWRWKGSVQSPGDRTQSLIMDSGDLESGGQRLRVVTGVWLLGSGSGESLRLWEHATGQQRNEDDPSCLSNVWPLLDHFSMTGKSDRFRGRQEERKRVTERDIYYDRLIMWRLAVMSLRWMLWVLSKQWEVRSTLQAWLLTAVPTQPANHPNYNLIQVWSWTMFFQGGNIRKRQHPEKGTLMTVKERLRARDL